MTDIVALDNKLKELNRQISDLTEARDKIIEERKKYINEETKHYDNFDDIIWELEALNAYTGFLSAFLGRRVITYKPVAVRGELYIRKDPDSQTPDWVAIGAQGVIDVAAPFWIMPLGGEVFLSDQEALNQRAREYEGGLRRPLFTWVSRSEGAGMRKAYLETHADPGGAYTQRNPRSLSSYGNE